MTAGERADLVLDAVGGPMFEPSLKSLRRGGRQIAITSTKDRTVTFDLVDFYHNESRLVRLILALLIAGAFAGLAAPSICFAQVQLPAVNLGDTNFEDAFGGPGWFLEEFPDIYVADELKDSHGNTIPGNNHVRSYSTSTHVAFTSNKRVLGGWLAAEVVQPLVDLDVRLANGTASRIRGFGDLTLGAGIQWPTKKIGNGVFAQRSMIDVGVPTGRYSDTRAINIGNNFVVVDPYYAFTYERKKIEFSIRLHYLWNSTNDGPYVGFRIKNAQPGQAFHVNYATSYELFKNVRVGFNGYWLQQLTDHQINGASVPNSRERTIGLGPGIQVGGEGTWFRVNSYIETDVRNRPSGFKVTCRFSKTLP